MNKFTSLIGRVVFIKDDPEGDYDFGMRIYDKILVNKDGVSVTAYIAMPFNEKYPETENCIFRIIYPEDFLQGGVL